MDAVTYTDNRVAEALNQHFVSAYFNTNEPGPKERELMREYRQLWTPTFIFLDHHKIELRRFTGPATPLN